MPPGSVPSKFLTFAFSPAFARYFSSFLIAALCPEARFAKLLYQAAGVSSPEQLTRTITAQSENGSDHSTPTPKEFEAAYHLFYKSREQIHQHGKEHLPHRRNIISIENNSGRNCIGCVLAQTRCSGAIHNCHCTATIGTRT